MYDFAQNTLRLRRIVDSMPNATEADIKAEYIRQGGLLNKEEVVVPVSVETKTPTKKTIKEKVVKAVKKVTKKK